MTNSKFPSQNIVPRYYILILLCIRHIYRYLYLFYIQFSGWRARIDSGEIGYVFSCYSTLTTIYVFVAFFFLRFCHWYLYTYIKLYIFVHLYYMVYPLCCFFVLLFIVSLLMYLTRYVCVAFAFVQLVSVHWLVAGFVNQKKLNRNCLVFIQKFGNWFAST